MTDIALPAAAKAKPRADESDLVKQRVRAAMWFLLPMLTALAIVAAWPWAPASFTAWASTCWTSATESRLEALAQLPLQPESPLPGSGGAVPRGSPELPLPLQPDIRTQTSAAPQRPYAAQRSSTCARCAVRPALRSP